jgi:hypothetical protein
MRVAAHRRTVNRTFPPATFGSTSLSHLYASTLAAQLAESATKTDCIEPYMCDVIFEPHTRARPSHPYGFEDRVSDILWRPPPSTLRSNRRIRPSADVCERAPEFAKLAVSLGLLPNS